jgi:uncharacterized protein (DUF2147 family)
MSNTWRIGAFFTAALAFAIAESASADPIGQWLTEGGRSRVRVAECGGALCGTVIWLKEPNDPETGKPKLDAKNADVSKRSRSLVGVQILLGAKPNGNKTWTGQVYNAEDGKTYSGTLTELGPNSLKLEGCALAGLICKAQTWTRAN